MSRLFSPRYRLIPTQLPPPRHIGILRISLLNLLFSHTRTVRHTVWMYFTQRTILKCARAWRWNLTRHQLSVSLQTKGPGRQRGLQFAENLSDEPRSNRLQRLTTDPLQACRGFRTKVLSRQLRPCDKRQPLARDRITSSLHMSDLP